MPTSKQLHLDLEQWIRLQEKERKLRNKKKSKKSRRERYRAQLIRLALLEWLRKEALFLANELKYLTAEEKERFSSDLSKQGRKQHEHLLRMAESIACKPDGPWPKKQITYSTIPPFARSLSSIVLLNDDTQKLPSSYTPLKIGVDLSVPLDDLTETFSRQIKRLKDGRAEGAGTHNSLPKMAEALDAYRRHAHNPKKWPA